MGKLRTGDIYDVLDVVKSLMCREKRKGLSTGERKMLTKSIITPTIKTKIIWLEII